MTAALGWGAFVLLRNDDSLSCVTQTTPFKMKWMFSVALVWANLLHDLDLYVRILRSDNVRIVNNLQKHRYQRNCPQWGGSTNYTSSSAFCSDIKQRSYFFRVRCTEKRISNQIYICLERIFTSDDKLSLRHGTTSLWHPRSIQLCSHAPRFYKTVSFPNS